jgi:HlyD family secretion protein
MNKTLGLFLTIAIICSCGRKQIQKQEPVTLPVTQIVGIGKVIPHGGISELAAPGSGIVKEIRAISGTKVKKGDILVQLDDSEQQLAVIEIENKSLTQKRAIESARIAADQKRSDLDDKLRKLADSKELLKNGAEKGENIKALQNECDQANFELKKLQNDLAIQESQLSEIVSQKNIRINKLGQTTLRAPSDGTILDIIPKTGEALSQYQKYALLAPESPLVIQAEIDEMFASSLTTGLKCSIRFSGEREPVASGRVVYISTDLKKKSLFSDSREDLEDRRVREIEISLDTTARSLLINTKVECSIQIK